MQKQEFVDKGVAADAKHPTEATGASLREPMDWPQHQLEASSPERVSSSGTYREGFEGWTETQGASLAVHSGPLAECQSPGSETSNNQPNNQGWNVSKSRSVKRALAKA